MSKLTLAKIQANGKKFNVVTPNGVTTYDDFVAANAAAEAYNDAQVALAEQAINAAANAAGRLEIISRDGKPIHGIPTVSASNRLVYKDKAGKITTEEQLCETTGYVLVSRDGSGAVMAGFGNPSDFGKFVKLTPDGIQKLRALLTATV